MIVPANSENIARAARIIRSGGIVAFPTETVYGLGADATNQSAVKRIFEAKGRPAHDPLIVHCSDLKQFGIVAESVEFSEQLNKLKSFWPGPLSVVLPRSKNVADAVCAELSSVAVRIPNHPIALELIKLSNRPIAAPSANQFSYVSPTSAQHVLDSLGEKVDLILDGGECEIGIESTVLSLLTTPATILRPGAITKNQLEKYLGSVALHDPLGDFPLLSPGMLDTHYSPRTPIRFIYDFEDSASSERIGVISFSDQISIDRARASSVIFLSTDHNQTEIAQKLFSALREMDSAGLDLILIDSCIEQGLGAAIMDRIKRAIGKRK